MPKPRSFVVTLVVVAIIAALSYFGYSRVKSIADAKEADSLAVAAGKAPTPERPDSAPQSFGAGAPIPVVGATVIRGPLIDWVSAQGQAAPSAQIAVVPEAAGKVAQVRVRENDVVKVGDTLLILDTTEMAFALRQAENQRRSAEATYKNELLVDYLITDPETRAQREAAARLRSGLESAELNLERAKLEFAKSVTLAPIAGRVANVKVVPGQRVGSSEILTIMAIDPIRVEVPVLQSAIGKVRPGNLARLVFGANSDTTLTGRVESINPLVDQSRTARVTVSLSNPNGMLLPGMTASVEVQSQTYQDRLLVPRGAILQRSEGRDMLFVYTPNAEGTDGWAEWRYVNLGLRNADYIEILPGIDGSQKLVAPGEIVLIDGHYTLQHQAQVRLVDKLTPEIRR